MKNIIYSLSTLFLLLAIGCSTTKKVNSEHNFPLMGIELYSFHVHPLDKALNMVDSTSAQYIEGLGSYDLGSLGAEFKGQSMENFDSKKDIQRFKSILKKRNLKMISMFTGGKNRKDWIRVFKQAQDLGLKYIVTEPDRKYWDLIDSLAGVYHVDIAIHEHAKGYSQYWHPDSVLAAMKGRPHIFACADLGHWARSGLDVVSCLKKLSGRIAELHIKDISKFGDLGAADVNLGDGVIDWPAVMKELKRQNFNGVAYIECEHNFNDNLEDVKHNINYFIAEFKKAK